MTTTTDPVEATSTAPSPEITLSDILPDLSVSDLHVKIESRIYFNEDTTHYRLYLLLDHDGLEYDEVFGDYFAASGYSDPIEFLEAVAPGLRRVEEMLCVARATCTRVSTYRRDGVPVSVALDDISADHALFANLFTVDSYNSDGDVWDESLSDTFDSWENGLLTVDQVVVAPAWRGRRLGQLLCVAAADRLSSGCRAVALHPSPIDSEFDFDSPEHALAVQGLTDLWASVGFHPWRDGISLLNPTSIDLENAYERLINEAGRPADA